MDRAIFFVFMREAARTHGGRSMVKIWGETTTHRLIHPASFLSYYYLLICVVLVVRTPSKKYKIKSLEKER